MLFYETLFIKPPFVVMDFETTGFSKTDDEVIEFAGILINKNWQIEDVFSKLAYPMYKKIPEKISLLTGITYNLLEEEKADKTFFVMEKFLNFVKDYPVVGHNINFDIGFINHALSIKFFDKNVFFENKKVDTLYLSRRLVKGLPSYNLESLTNYFGLDICRFHRALADTNQTFEIYKKLYTIGTNKLI